MNNTETIQSLRDMADFIEKHQDLLPQFLPTHISAFYHGNAPKEAAALIAKAMGKAAKRPSSDGTDLILERNFGKQTMRFWFKRNDICERVVVGTKVVPAKPAKLVPATPERKEEIIEWHCASILNPDVEPEEAA